MDRRDFNRSNFNEIDINQADPYGSYGSGADRGFGGNPPPSNYPQQQPPPQSVHPHHQYPVRPITGPQHNEHIARNYNDYLERQGIPALSPEDVQLLRECARESLYYRCLPITTAMCAGLLYTARTRQIQPRFYHYLGAVFFGYFVGKLSYRSKCEEKLINSRSNSPFVNAIRKRKGLFVEELGDGSMIPADASQESDWTIGGSSTSGFTKSYGIHEFDNRTSPFGGDTKRNQDANDRAISGRDDYYGGNVMNPSAEMSPNDDGHLDPGTGGITYDDLRNRNRSMYKNI